MRVTDPSEASGSGLFAPDYARYRPDYPAALFKDLIHHWDLDDAGAYSI